MKAIIYSRAMDAHSLIVNFRDFIAANWVLISALDKQDKSDALLIDWLQVNWEMLVERHLPLPIMLEVYGDGADNGKSSRIQVPDARATHMVVCAAENNFSLFDNLNKVEVCPKADKLVFDRFVTFRSNGWYYEEPPFDMALCFIKEREIVLNVENIVFKIALTTK